MLRMDRGVSEGKRAAHRKTGEGYRIDLLVESSVIVELKTVEHLTELHRMQLLTYLRLAHKQVGLLLNFNTLHVKSGIVRVVNGYDGAAPSGLNKPKKPHIERG